MPKEPGENRLGRESAETALAMLAEALHETERKETVDMNEPSEEPWAPELRGLMDQKETIEMALEVLEADIEQLDPQKRHEADGLIIRAKIYLAAHEPKKEK